MGEWLADTLLPQQLATKPFLPLPVLGAPGWWAANESPDFYRDDAVFRPPKNKQRPEGRCSEPPGAASGAG